MTARNAQDDVWGVLVDEVKINAISGSGRDWWFAQSARLECAGRTVVVDICIAGAHVHVAAEDRDEADWIREHMIASGVHQRAVAVKTLASCRKTVRDRHATYGDHKYGCEYCRTTTTP
jgi:hypothetical protein